jgi:hypothetical protein
MQASEGFTRGELGCLEDVIQIQAEPGRKRRRTRQFLLGTFEVSPLLQEKRSSHHASQFVLSVHKDTQVLRRMSKASQSD